MCVCVCVCMCVCVCVFVCVGGIIVGPCFVLHYLVSSFAIISLGKTDSWLLYLNCLLMSFDS